MEPEQRKINETMIKSIAAILEKQGMNINNYIPEKAEIRKVWNKQKDTMTHNLIKARCKKLSRTGMIKDQHKQVTKDRVKSFKDIQSHNWS